MLRKGGGDAVRGDAIELYPLPLALLELFLLLLPVLRNRVRRMVFIKDACAGEKWLPAPQVAPAALAVPPLGVEGGLNGVAAELGFCSLCTWGVVNMASSSPPILASSSLSVDSLSEPIMLTLPTELLTALLSGPTVLHGMLPDPTRWGESRAIPLMDSRRPGMGNGFCMTTGDEPASL